MPSLADNIQGLFISFIYWSYLSLYFVKIDSYHSPWFHLHTRFTCILQFFCTLCSCGSISPAYTVSHQLILKFPVCILLLLFLEDLVLECYKELLRTLVIENSNRFSHPKWTIPLELYCSVCTVLCETTHCLLKTNRVLNKMCWFTFGPTNVGTELVPSYRNECRL